MCHNYRDSQNESCRATIEFSLVFFFICAQSNVTLKKISHKTSDEKIMENVDESIDSYHNSSCFKTILQSLKKKIIGILQKLMQSYFFEKFLLAT